MSAEGSTCSICLEGLRAPRELPCHHSFCEACLQEFIDKLVKKKNGKTKNFDCPNCRKPVSPPGIEKPPSEWAKQFPLFPKSHATPEFQPSPIIQRKCNPCQYEEKDIDATRYCMECREYMCEECYTFHKKMSATRKHRIIKANEIGIKSSTSDGQFRKERCPCLWNKTLKYHCQTHDVFCCGNCKTENHGSCKNVANIANRSEDIRLYGEIEKALTNMDQLRDNFRDIINSCELNEKSIEHEKAQIIKSIRQTHADLKSLLARVEASMIEDVNIMCNKATSSLTQQMQRCSAAVAEVETSVALLKSANEAKDNDQVFISYQRLQKEMEHYISALKNISKEGKQFKFHWNLSEEVQNLKRNLKTFGTIRMETQATEEVFVGCTASSIKKSLEERDAKKINCLEVAGIGSGCFEIACLTAGRIIVAHSSGNVFMVGSNGNCISRCKLSETTGVAVISENEVAVTTNRQTVITFLSTRGSLTVARTATLESYCHAIAYCRSTEELVVTASKKNGGPNSVQILTLTGVVVKTIERDSTGDYLLSTAACRMHVAVNDVGNKVYVSDSLKGVVCVDRDGNVLFKYTKVSYPLGISIDSDGNIYVCGSSNDVHQLSPDGTKARIILSSKDGLNGPEGLFFSRRDDTLFLRDDYSRPQITLYKMQ